MRVIRDSSNRVWITVSTRVNPWDRALCSTLADGYVLLLEHGKLRIVAEGFAFANELKLDAAQEWLYVPNRPASGSHGCGCARTASSLTARCLVRPTGRRLIDGIAIRQLR